MSHELDIQNGKAAIAYVGDTPWHGLGQQLTEDADIDTWRREAGMKYEILTAPLSLTLPEDQGTIKLMNKVGLYRSDNQVPLGVVGNRYHVVQPEDVLEFFRDLTEERGFILETAGVLFSGSKYWAMARTPHELQLGEDSVKEHLLLATACDGSMATTARYVRTRVVCNNTIMAALSEKDGGKVIRVEHRSKFDSKAVKRELKLVDESWAEFIDQTKQMADTKVSYKNAAQYFIEMFGNPEVPMDEQTSHKPEELYLQFINHDFLGGNMAAANQTLWGMVNVVTEHVDWHQGEIQDRRLKNAWFGKGADLKVKAFQKAFSMIGEEF